MTVRAVTMRREFARSHIRLMKMKINDLQGRNRNATARHNSAARRRSTSVERYFFFSILVMVSPDCVKDT